MANRTRITDARARAFGHAVGCEAVLWDVTGPGFGPWVSSDGGKTWIVRQRQECGRPILSLSSSSYTTYFG